MPDKENQKKENISGDKGSGSSVMVLPSFEKLICENFDGHL